MPMWAGQSIGFGISAGDQQYVTGTRSVSRSLGPSELGTGSRSTVALHSLMTSPSLPPSDCQHHFSLDSHSFSPPLPGHPLHQPKGSIIRYSRVDPTFAYRHIRKRVCEMRRASPRHREHDVQRDRQRLRAMYVSEAWRIRNNSVCHKRYASVFVRIDA